MSDTVNWELMYTVVNKLGIRGYKQKYFEICAKLWRDYVPQTGACDCVQGELLRQAEKLRNEAMDNGNKNWDENYESYCEYIKKTLTESGVFSDAESEKLSKAIDYVSFCGNYALAYNTGKISDEKVNPVYFAYVDDDLYDYIEDAIALFAQAHPEKIYYEAKGFAFS